METHHIREWRKARKLTQAELAERVGLTEVSVNRIENGKQRLVENNLAAFAAALDCSIPALFERPPEGTRPLADGELAQVGSVSIPATQPQPQASRADLPVYDTHIDATGKTRLRFEPVDWIRRPDPLRNARGGFAIYALGEKAEPAYRQGDLVFVHPALPINPGDDVLAVHTSRTGEHEIEIGCLVSDCTESAVLLQHNPGEEHTLPRRSLHAVYLIVGKTNRR